MWISKLRWKTRSPDVDLKKAQHVADHIDHCMLKFTTYFMIGQCYVDSDADGKDNDECQVIALAIVEKDVLMTSGEERSLIHYFLVDADFRFKNVGTAMLKMIMSPKEYCDRKVMFVTNFAKKYSTILNKTRYDEFFQKFSFEVNVKKAKYKKGDNDVDKLVLPGCEVQCTDVSSIKSAACNLKDFKTAYGYYEIDNSRKFSICANPHDGHIYGKSAHYRWDIIDTDEEEAFPAQQVKKARDNTGCEIWLNSSGSRQTTAAVTPSLKRPAENIAETFETIPECFQQKTHNKSNGCVWLSASMLLYSVNRVVGLTMAQCYAEDKLEQRYEWLDIFPRKNRSNMTTMVKKRGSLVNQMQQLKGHDYDVLKIKLTKEFKNVNDVVLKQRKHGLFVVVLEDSGGITSHAVGIDVGKKKIYDCMEEKIMLLNHDNLSICCGNDAEFVKIGLGCELKPKAKREKKSEECNVLIFDSVQCQFDMLFCLIEVKNKKIKIYVMCI